MTVSLLSNRGRVVKTLHSDAHDEGRMVEVMHENLDPIIELARSLAIVRQQARERDGMRLVGFMPTHVMENMMRNGSWNDKQAVKNWFNDPQNKDFRVWKGKV